MQLRSRRGEASDRRKAPGDHRGRRRAVFARTSELGAFAKAHGIPVIETIAGRANLLADDPLNIGPVGVTGSDSANAVAAEADVILAVGTRLQDFTTAPGRLCKGRKARLPQCRSA